MAARIDQQHVDDYAFGLFVSEGIQYYLEQHPTHFQISIYIFFNRLRNIWQSLNENEQEPWLEQARERIQETANQRLSFRRRERSAHSRRIHMS
jgi:hypothetical protein